MFPVFPLNPLAFVPIPPDPPATLVVPKLVKVALTRYRVPSPPPDTVDPASSPRKNGLLLKQLIAYIVW
jgi:hypothetical protein